MYDGTFESNGIGRQAELLQLRRNVEAELARGPFGVGLKAPLRDAYHSAIAVSRSQELLNLCQLSSLIYLLAVLLANLLLQPAPVWLDVALQCVLTPFLALSIAHFAFRPEHPAWLREGGALAIALCFSLATLLGICEDGSPVTALNLSMVSLAAVAALFLLHLRFAAALALVLLTASALWMALLVHADVPAAFRGTPLGFLLAICAPALFSVHRREREARRVYLNSLLQELRIEQLACENSLLSQLSATDSLTGAANRRQLEKALRLLCAEPPCGDFLLLADIDFFKRFNDRHGHMAGDACLREVVGAIRCHLRRSDLVARFGGEEFAIILPHTCLADALVTAERIRAGVANRSIIVNGRPETVTISIGLAERDSPMSPATLMALADAALYAAKAAGRDLIRCAAQTEQGVAA